MLEFMIILTVLFIGALLQGASGFGFSLFAMGLLTIFLTVKDSMLLLVALGIVTSFKILITYWKHIVWKELLYLLAAAFIGRTIAFFFVNTYGETEMMKQWLGLLLIALVIYMLLKPSVTLPVHSSGKIILPLGLGLIAGFTGGAFAIGGPFFVLYLLIRFEDKRNYNANLQGCFVVLNSYTLLLHGFNGDLSSQFYLYFLSGFIVVWLGVQLGLRFFDRLPRELVQKVASVIVLLAGLNLLIFS